MRKVKELLNNDIGSVSVEYVGIVFIIILICTCLFLFGNTVVEHDQIRYTYTSGTGWERFDPDEGQERPEEEIDDFLHQFAPKKEN